jgi:hypothetical protein
MSERVEEMVTGVNRVEGRRERRNRVERMGIKQ